MKLKSINIIISAIAVIATALIIYLICPEQMSELYKVNIALIFLLELVVINAIYIATKSKNYNVQTIAIANLIIKPLVFMTIWLILYSLLLTELIDTKYYYIGQIIIPSIYAILALITAQAGAVQQENDREAKVRDEILKEQKVDMFRFQQQVKKSIKFAQTGETVKCTIETKLQLLSDKVRFNGAIMSGDSYISSSLDEIVEMAALIETSPTNEDLTRSVLEKINSLIEYINSKK